VRRKGRGAGRWVGGRAGEGERVWRGGDAARRGGGAGRRGTARGGGIAPAAGGGLSLFPALTLSQALSLPLARSPALFPRSISLTHTLSLRAARAAAGDASAAVEKGRPRRWLPMSHPGRLPQAHSGNTSIDVQFAGALPGHGTEGCAFVDWG
jgi:hypothetical protein